MPYNSLSRIDLGSEQIIRGKESDPSDGPTHSSSKATVFAIKLLYPVHGGYKLSYPFALASQSARSSLLP
jgi:hypothetical protein